MFLVHAISVTNTRFGSAVWPKLRGAESPAPRSSRKNTDGDMHGERHGPPAGGTGGTSGGLRGSPGSWAARASGSQSGQRRRATAQVRNLCWNRSVDLEISCMRPYTKRHSANSARCALFLIRVALGMRRCTQVCCRFGGNAHFRRVHATLPTFTCDPQFNFMLKADTLREIIERSTRGLQKQWKQQKHQPSQQGEQNREKGRRSSTGLSSVRSVTPRGGSSESDEARNSRSRGSPDESSPALRRGAKRARDTGRGPVLADRPARWAAKVSGLDLNGLTLL